MLEQIISMDEQYYMNTFGKRIPAAFERGEGMTLYDVDGNAYTDFFAGIAVSALGHAHPILTAALSDQVKKLLHTSSVYYIEQQARLAKELCTRSCFDRAFFCSTGAEANEGAMKLARKYFYERGEERYAFVTLERSFHGRTITTATATGQEKYSKPYAPLTPGFTYVPLNDLDAIKTAIGPHTAGVMLELIQGESGVHPADAAYIQAVRKLCDENGILLIVDEVQTGMGRTGKLFCYEHYGIEPDIVTLAKALGGGVPIGAVLAKESVAQAFHPGDHGTTFGGNPLSTRAGLAVLEAFDAEDLIQNAADMGTYFAEKLRALPGIAEVRGRGLMIGADIAGGGAKAVQHALFEKHYLVGCVGDTTLRLLPPLIVKQEDIDGFIAALADVLEGK